MLFGDIILQMNNISSAGFIYPERNLYLVGDLYIQRVIVITRTGICIDRVDYINHAGDILTVSITFFETNGAPYIFTSVFLHCSKYLALVTLS